MIQVSIDNTFQSWRDASRKLLRAGVLPENIVWSPAVQNGLFSGDGLTELPTMTKPHVSPDFIKLAETSACFDDPERWAVFYRLLFRLVYENRNLLSIESDADVRRIDLMAKAVRRDIHKFHAFVRFRLVVTEGKEIYVAWHEPQHFTLERAVPFFVRRFGSMNFSILTPKGCAHWDQKELHFSPPALKEHAPETDETEEFWLLYYKSIFNPFRLKVKTMKRELPVRHWLTLPEAVLIPELIRKAESL